jgi:hypothetical protein
VEHQRLGVVLGTHRGIWRTQLRAPHRRGSTRGRCTRRGRLTAARGNSGEQMCANQCSTQGNRGAGRLLTLRGSAGGTGQRRGHMDMMGRRWWSSGCARTTPVSMDRTDQRERERAQQRVSRVADGKAKLTVALDGARAQRWPRNRRWTLAGGGGGSRFAWAEREREREREVGRGRKWKRRGGRAGHGVQKGRGGSVVAGERADVGASTAGRSWARD